MARHVSWRAGGRADRFYRARRPRRPARVPARSCRASEPVLFVGLGCNLLVRDGGFRGTVVLTHSRARLRPEHATTACVYAEAGVAAPKVARFAAMHELRGRGVPGRHSRHRRRRAGDERRLLRRRDLGHRRAACVTIDRARRAARAQPRRIRHRLPALRAEAPARDEWFVGAWFALAAGDGDASRARIKELLARRIATQPLKLPNAGSVFRNPPGDHAARLIESCGLKGLRAAARGSREKHANFIVNPEGAASAADIECADRCTCRTTVLEQTRRRPDPEVRIVGESRHEMSFGKVAVLLGGKSAEREISLMSGGMVLAALRSQRRGRACVRSGRARAWTTLMREGFDARVHRAARPLRRGRHGAGRLEWLGIPYTGSGVLASALAMDKLRTKLIWQRRGLPTPRYEMLDEDTDWAARRAASSGCR